MKEEKEKLINLYYSAMWAGNNVEEASPSMKKINTTD